MDKSLFLYIILFLVPFFANAQEANFELLSAKDGLANNKCETPAQDERGFIWFLSSSKIHRYDGHNFWMHPPPPNDIPGSDESFLALKVYQDSLLFLIGQTHVFLLNPNTAEWQSFPLELGENVYYKEHSLQQLGKGDFIFSVWSRTVNELDFWRFHQGELIHLPLDYKGLDKPTTFLSAIDRHNNSYFFDQGKLKQYSSEGIFQREILLDAVGSSIEGIRMLENLWINTDKLTFIINERELFTLSNGSDRLEAHPINKHLSDLIKYSFHLAENGDVWLITTRPDGIFHYDAARDQFVLYGDQLKAVSPYALEFNSLYLDQTGILWVSSQFGLLKITAKPSLFQTYFNQKEEACNGFCSFRGITEDSLGNIYASFYRGMAKIDKDQKKTSLQRLENFEPFDLVVEGNYLILNSGLQQSIDHYERREIKGVIENPYDVGVFSTDENNQLWWGVRPNIFRLDKTKEQWEWVRETQFGRHRLDAMHFGKKSALLWTSHGGVLSSFTPANKEVNELKISSTLGVVSHIFAIEENREGHLWLATDIGLLKYDPAREEVLLSYSEEDGLANNYISGLLADGDSCLWLSTNNGLSRFHIEDESFINFYKEDGLTHNEFNRISYHKARDGKMYFGGLQGINSFYPDELMKRYQRENKKAKVVLSSFESFDNRTGNSNRTYHFSAPQEISLYHWNRSFTFEYALTDYQNSANVYYSYQMEGYENRWSEPSKFNFTRFTSLPSGSYVFRVKARDNQGLWHPNELKINIIVHPPWWASWWAYCIYALLIAGIGTGILFFFRRRWKLQNQLELEHQESIRLKELDEFKSRFYTNITHEFKTPLTLISGTNQQLLKGAQTEEEKSKLRLIKRSSENLNRLVNQLLDLSKLDSSSLQFNYVQGDILSYLHYITESLYSLANSQNIMLRLKSDEASIIMDYDPERLLQIVYNLLSNAIKFTNSGGFVNITVNVKNSTLHLVVEDNGVGISEKDLPYVFDRFYQAENLRKAKVGGTGVGLALTKELVNLMGGKISVTSTEGEGSSFVVVLPITNKAEFVKSQNNEVINNDSNSLSLKPSTISQGKAEDTLLIIEDNPDIVEYLKSCLEERYILDFAYNGRSGIEKALELIPDIIISDVMMPEKNGFEVTETIKNHELTSHIPIILLTAKSDIDSKIDGLRRGADAYLTKPFNQEELIVTLEKLLELRKKMQIKYRNFDPSKPATITSKEQNVESSIFDIDTENIFLQKVITQIEKNLDNVDYNVPMLSKDVGLSQSQLYRKIKALTNQSTVGFIRSYRLARGKDLLEKSDLSISEIAYQVGFSTLSYFSDAFLEEFGIRPNTIRN